MYTALSEVYDLFYDSDEEKRADYYARFISGNGMDLGCGTGALTLELMRRGLNVYGVDSSAQMLNKATLRAQRAGINAKFILGDAANPPYLEPLDFILAANDVYNYLPGLDVAFKRAYNALRDGGTLAFDISSKYKLTEILANSTFTQTKSGVTYVWQNCKRGKKIIIDFTVFSPCGELYAKTEETQVQYIYSEQDVISSLTRAGFKSVAVYELLKFKKPSLKSQKIAFIAKK